MDDQGYTQQRPLNDKDRVVKGLCDDGEGQQTERANEPKNDRDGQDDHRRCEAMNTDGQ